MRYSSPDVEKSIHYSVHFPSLQVQEYGTAIMYNLGTKEVKTVVFDDVAPELAMAILQFFSTHPPEELLWRAMTALCR